MIKNNLQDWLHLLVTKKISMSKAYDNIDNQMYLRVYNDLAKQLQSLAKSISDNKITFEQAIQTEQFQKAKYHSFILLHGPGIVHNR